MQRASPAWLLLVTAAACTEVSTPLAELPVNQAAVGFLPTRVDTTIYGPPRDHGRRGDIQWTSENTALLRDEGNLAMAVEGTGDSAYVSFKDPETPPIVDRVRGEGATLRASLPSVSARSVTAGRLLIESAGGRILRRYRHLPGVAAELPRAVLLEVLKSPYVDYVFPLGTFQLNGAYLSSGNTVNRPPLGQVTPPNIDRIRAPEAWDSSTGGGVKITIMDTGVFDGWATHQDLPGIDPILDPFACLSFIPDEPSCNDGINGHGTMVAGVIMARDNEIAVVGVAPGPPASLAFVKVCYPAPWRKCHRLAVGDALQWAAHNGEREIVNMSLGDTLNHPLWAEGVSAAYAAGDLLVAAAGNLSDTPQGPGYVQWPARYPEVIAVSGTTLQDQFHPQSASGPAVELAAPFEVLSTTIHDSVATNVGTSFAAPAVAGVAALLWTMFPTWTNADVRYALGQFGRVDLGATGRDQYFGFGRVDALNAVRLTSSPPPFSITISGPEVIRPYDECTWIATVLTGGTGPFAYDWRRDGVQVGTAAEYIDGMDGETSFLLALTVVDAIMRTATDSLTVTGNGSNPCLEF